MLYSASLFDFIICSFMTCTKFTSTFFIMQCMRHPSFVGSQTMILGLMMASPRTTTSTPYVLCFCYGVSYTSFFHGVGLHQASVRFHSLVVFLACCKIDMSNIDISFSDSNWINAIQEELNQFTRNHVYLVPKTHWDECDRYKMGV